MRLHLHVDGLSLYLKAAALGIALATVTYLVLSIVAGVLLFKLLAALHMLVAAW